MNPAKRIASNTLAVFFRSTLSAGLTIFSSRWILLHLGQVDYGLFNVVTALIVFVSFFSNIMVSTNARFFSVAIGKNNIDEIRQWYSTSRQLHVYVSILFFFIGLPIGELFIRKVLNIPLGRLEACLWVYRISIVYAVMSFISVPATAMFTAKQKITEIAWWGLAQSIVLFIFSYVLRYFNGDKLLIYSVGVSVCTSIFQIIILLRCQLLFFECRALPRRSLNKSYLKSLLTFSTWNAIGTLGGIGRDQGSTILLNLFFGPQVNAAYSIANRVSTQANQLGFALIGALAPEISSSEGKGDRKRVINLSLRSGLWGTILLLIIAIPLLFEMDGVLAVWLVSVPEYSAVFCRLILITFIIDRLGVGYWFAFNAVGNIILLQLFSGILLILSLPVSYVFFLKGFPPSTIAVSFIFSIVALLIARVILGKRILGVAVSLWFKEVLLPFLFAIGSMCLIAFLCSLLKWPVLIRTSVSCALCCISAIFILMFSISRNERQTLFHRYLRKSAKQSKKNQGVD